MSLLVESDVATKVYDTSRILQKAYEMHDELESQGQEHGVDNMRLEGSGVPVGRNKRLRERYLEVRMQQTEQARADASDLLEGIAGMEAALAAKEAWQREQEEPTGTTAEETFTDFYKKLLRLFGIHIQRYWNGTMVGPDVRRFLKHRNDIYTQIQNKINASGKAGHADFAARHLAVLGPLAVVCHLSRAMRVLDLGERQELITASKEFARAWRVSFPERQRLTIKGHLIEDHIPKEILKHGSLGFFAAEACESFHAVDNKTRRMLRTVTNPEAFAEAMLKYRTQYQMLAPETREIKRRKTNRKSTGSLPGPQ